MAPGDSADSLRRTEERLVNMGNTAGKGRLAASQRGH